MGHCDPRGRKEDARGRKEDARGRKEDARGRKENNIDTSPLRGRGVWVKCPHV